MPPRKKKGATPVKATPAEAAPAKEEAKAEAKAEPAATELDSERCSRYEFA